MKRVDFAVGIRANVCANGETWEFGLTLGQMRVGTSVFKEIRGEQPSLDEMSTALAALLQKAQARL